MMKLPSFLILMMSIILIVTGVFGLLNWQDVPIVWARYIVFIEGCISLLLAGMSTTMWVMFVYEEKDE